MVSGTSRLTEFFSCNDQLFLVSLMVSCRVGQTNSVPVSWLASVIPSLVQPAYQSTLKQTSEPVLLLEFIFAVLANMSMFRKGADMLGGNSWHLLFPRRERQSFDLRTVALWETPKVLMPQFCVEIFAWSGIHTRCL
jgi:hypothetical protein